MSALTEYSTTLSGDQLNPSSVHLRARIHSPLSSAEIQKVHGQVTDAEIASKLLPDSHGGAIVSWAFEGDTLAPKPPCLRCLRLYKSWSMLHTPANITEKQILLGGFLETTHDRQQSLQQGHEVKNGADVKKAKRNISKKEGKASNVEKEPERRKNKKGTEKGEDNPVFCAETAAAAKLNLIHKGNLSLG